MSEPTLKKQMEKRTVKQLREEAKEKGISRYTCLRKSEIIEALLKAEEPPTRKPRKVELVLPNGKKLTPIMKQQLVPKSKKTVMPIKKKVVPPGKNL